MIRRSLLITCTTLAILAAIAWLATQFWAVYLQIPLPGANGFISVYQMQGRVEIEVYPKYYNTSEFELQVKSVAAGGVYGGGFRIAWNNPFQYYLNFEHVTVRRGRFAKNGFLLNIHHLILFFIFSLWPLYAYYKHQKRNHRPDPHCTQCDYNLRGSLESKSCPECGCVIDL